MAGEPAAASRADSAATPSWISTIAQAAVLGAAYWFAVSLAGKISIPNISIAPIRLPNAFAIVALALTPPSRWWVFLLAIAPRNIVVSNAVTGILRDPAISLLYLGANSFEIVTTAAILRRFGGGRPRLDGLAPCLAFVAVGVIGAPLVSGFIGAFAVQRLYPAVAFLDSWRVWSFGDAVGNVAVVPALLELAAIRSRVATGVRPARVVEAAAVLVAVVAGSLPALGILGDAGTSNTTALWMLYVPFPLLVWAGLRFGAAGAAAATLLLATLSVLSALQGRGPFAQPEDGAGVLILQQFIVVAGATAVTLAGVADERRRTLGALQDSERRYRSLFDTATDVVVTTDLAGRIDTVNTAGEALTGWTRADWREQPITAFLDPEEAAAALLRLREIADGGDSVPHLWRVRTRAGDWRVAEVKGSVFTEGGEPAGILLIGRDVTERQRAEAERARLENEIAQSRKLEAVGQLAGGIAHDFNNLLQAILGFTDLTREHLPPDSGGLASLDKVKQAGERARDLTRQLLTFSRREVMHPTVLDLSGAVAETAQILKRVLPANIRLLISSDTATPPVLADRGHIDQIVMNLCVNARDAMPDGGTISLAVGVRRLDAAFVATRSWAREGSFVTVQVGDSGEGIAPQFLPRIFEPFFTTKDVGLGTGLGLATVYAIVTRYNGLIEVDTEIGRGTTITVYLPPSRQPAEAAAAAAKPKPPRGHGELILVAEDEAAVRELVVQQLSRAGYRVVAARDGEEALQLFDTYGAEIRLMFLDVMMPNGDGRHVRAIVGERRPEMPVLFATGYGDRGGGRREPIVDPLIEKPYSGATLLARVRAILDEQVHADISGKPT